MSFIRKPCFALFDRHGFTPDWTEVWTAAQAEKELTHLSSYEGDEEKKFVFNGPGWYIAKDLKGGLDVILVIPLVDETDALFAHTWPRDTQFQFNVYNGRDPAQLFGLIATAPTRLDER